MIQTFRLGTIVFVVAFVLISVFVFAFVLVPICTYMQAWGIGRG
jgi:hypothetical protein